MDQKKLTEEDLRSFIALLAGSQPTPGGGGAGALIGAVGCAAGMMTASLTVGRERYKDLAENAQQALNQGRLQEDLRQDAIDQASRDSARVPLDVLRLCREAADLLLSLEGKINPTCISDLGVGAAALSSAAKSSWINILINLKSLSGRDDPFVISAYAEGKRLMEYVTGKCDALYERVLDVYSF